MTILLCINVSKYIFFIVLSDILKLDGILIIINVVNYQPAPVNAHSLQLMLRILNQCHVSQFYIAIQKYFQIYINTCVRQKCLCVSKQSNNGDYKNFVVTIVRRQFCVFTYQSVFFQFYMTISSHIRTSSLKTSSLWNLISIQSIMING